MDEIIALIAKEGIVAGSFIFMLYFFLTKFNTTLERIALTLETVSAELNRVDARLIQLEQRKIQEDMNSQSDK